jgi:pentose-5-phosphate-3-epimerase
MHKQLAEAGADVLVAGSYVLALQIKLQPCDLKKLATL